MDFETIATYTKVIQRLSSAELISFHLRATCVICERGIKYWRLAGDGSARINSQKNSSEPP